MYGGCTFENYDINILLLYTIMRHTGHCIIVNNEYRMHRRGWDASSH